MSQVDSTVRVTAIVTAYQRIEHTLQTLRRIESCRPRPDEILVHVDGNQIASLEAIRASFPYLDVIVSATRVGPASGRNKLVERACNELIASFDDDSYPIDVDYFARLQSLATNFPAAALLSANIFQKNDTFADDQMVISSTASFGAGGVVLRRSEFLAVGGFVPLLVTYGMEEEDLAFRLLDHGQIMLHSPWLRVFHDSDLSHHNSAQITSGSIANLALLVFLRYPRLYWFYGALQLVNRIIWCLKVGRRTGILAGLLAIPAHLVRHRHLRRPVSVQTMRLKFAKRKLRFFPITLGNSQPPNLGSWTVCQIGAREHYALPRALHGRGLLRRLVTDVWVRPKSLTSFVPSETGRRLRSRYDPELETARVEHFTTSFVRHEVACLVRRNISAWHATMARNELFQENTVLSLRRSGALQSKSGRPIVFAYAYAGLRILEEAKNAGAITVLGQIDGGECDAQLIEEVCSKHATNARQIPGPPARYWEQWRAECRLADYIVVNSQWSKDLLTKSGIPAAKVTIVPPIYDTSEDASSGPRIYPREFSIARPMRVLFLGALSVRKGVIDALNAAFLMQKAPIEFWFVGSDPHSLGRRAQSIPNVHWHGAVSRRDVQNWYQRADAFLFPTHSDGFGLTQLEAQASRLPVISSRYCGRVVESGVNGLVIKEVSPEAIAESLNYLISNTKILADMSLATRSVLAKFSSARVLPQLLSAVDQRA